MLYDETGIDQCFAASIVVSASRSEPGERRDLPPSLLEDLSWLKARTSLPICVGFGVSTPAHARLLRDAADGVIVGSALVRRLSAVDAKPREEVLKDVAEYVRSLAAALEPDAVSTR